ncbi:MAG: adenylate/guanylate cyclase domain-containing protein, partial [Pseudomonadota bacterium]
LEEKLGRAAYLDLLNGFFEGTTQIINDNGGEVLKFIGDAVLAIFPAGEDAKAASTQALDSAKQIVKHFREPAGGNGTAQPTENIDCAIGIDFGRVTYGNIGSQERLDFTVIGKAANVAARLAEYGKPAGHRIVASATIASGDGDAQSLGALDLHNVSEPVKAMAISQ